MKNVIKYLKELMNEREDPKEKAEILNIILEIKKFNEEVMKNDE